jgi:hypothetical protein
MNPVCGTNRDYGNPFHVNCRSFRLSGDAAHNLQKITLFLFFFVIDDDMRYDYYQS